MGKYSAIVVAVWAVSTARCSGRTPDAREAAPGTEAEAPGSGADAEAAVPVPPEVLAALDTCSVTVEVHPQPAGVEDRGPGLRSVLLHRPGVRLEPPGLWPDGTPVSADAAVEADEMRRLLEALAASGFFSRATRHHSEARPSPATPPPDDSTAGLPERAPDPNWTVIVRTHDEDWHLARIASWPLGDDGLAVLGALERVAGPAAAELLARLRTAL